MPVTQHVNDTLFTFQNMSYFTKHVSICSFSGLIYNNSSLVKEDVDQNVIWDGLVFSALFLLRQTLCAVFSAFTVGRYHLWENVHRSGKQ